MNRSAAPPVAALLAAALCAWAGGSTADEVCAPRVEAHADGATAALRPHDSDLVRCTLDEPGYRRTVAAWLAQRPAAAPPLRGMSLGRAVNLPWVSQHLARAALADPRWDAARGRPRQGDINALAAAILSAPDLRERLDAPLAGTPWTVRAVSVEKVLVARTQDVLPGAGKGRIPYDAQLWLVIDRRPD